MCELEQHSITRIQKVQHVLKIGVGQRYQPWYEEATNANMPTDEPHGPRRCGGPEIPVGYSNF